MSPRSAAVAPRPRTLSQTTTFQDPGTTSGSSPKPTVTSISIPAAMRPGPGTAHGTKANVEAPKSGAIVCESIVYGAPLQSNSRAVLSAFSGPRVGPRIQHYAPLLGVSTVCV